MRYVLLIYGEENWMDGLSEDEQRAHMARWGEYDVAMREAGIAVAGEALDRTANARTVRSRSGEPIVTDGPFAETREQLGGFYVLDCKDIDEALGWAAKIPDVAEGCVEVRPVMDYEAAGYEGATSERADA
jgi:hypothetical protein